jgi:hypothetical protein
MCASLQITASGSPMESRRHISAAIGSAHFEGLPRFFDGGFFFAAFLGGFLGFMVRVWLFLTVS